MNLPSIAFFGDVGDVSHSGAQRLSAAQAAGAPVPIVVDYGQLTRSGPWATRLARLLGRPALPGALVAFNAALLARCADQPAPAVAWFEWPRWVLPETLRALRARWPQTRFVCFQDDNPFGERRETWQWPLFIENIAFFDLHFVKRDEDLVTFRGAGARRVEKFLGGYSPALLAAGSPSATQDLDVSFIGTAMEDRPDWLLRLRREHGIAVHAFGGKWLTSRFGRAYPGLVHPHANGTAYVETITRSRICLGFVSRSNRDGYSMRSFEIPALGGFFLAARTPEHQALYREGVEAEFFDGPDECADKIRHHLADAAARSLIADAGRQACIRKYSLVDCMSKSLAMAWH